MINLKDLPKSSGVYLFKVNEEIIYIGSSKNLYQRMTNHKSCINKGSNGGHKTDFYQFLQSNQFKVEFQITDNYKQLEQELIEKYNPKYNAFRAFTGCGAEKGRENEYGLDYYYKYHNKHLQLRKQHYELHKEEILEQRKQHYESHKEEAKQYQKQYQNQLCSYNGETLTLNALSKRFGRKGISNPTQEAKKYLFN